MIGMFFAAAFAAEVVVGRDAETVQDAVEQAEAGDTVVLPEGRWDGPVTISKALTITSRDGVLVGSEGSTLRIEAPGAIVSGLKIEGSGSELRGPDACIYVSTEATGTQIRDGTFSDCLFGVWLQQVTDAHVVDNDIEGRPEAGPANKGNGIHLHDCTRLEVRGNTIRDARDGIYVSATDDSKIVGNNVSNLRFGIHYMYSYRNELRDNVANSNSGGIALMQSRNLRVINNTTNDNRRHGILFRDTIDSVITGNSAVGNNEGFFFFSSVRNIITDNSFSNNTIGMRVWAGTVENTIEKNAFINNRQQVFYVASEDQTWGSNFWSDYLGWDQNKDGLGDRVYRSEAFTSRLLYRYPAAVLLLSSPTLELLAHLQARVPALQIPSVVDSAPLLAAPSGGAQ